MTELIVVTYPDATRAAEVVATLRRLQAAHLIDLDDLVFVTRDDEGCTELHHSVTHPLGAFWGGLVGKLFSPSWLRVNRSFVRELSAHMPADSSAVFGLVRKSTPDKVLPVLGQFGGTVLHTSLSDEYEEKLQAALSAGERKSASLRAAARRTPTPRMRRVVGGHS